jgi:opacity protein-like surface antigen
MKKLNIALLAAALSAAALTVQASPYIGLNIGYTNGLFTNKTTNTGVAVKSSTGTDGLDGAVFAGYAHKFGENSFNLAAEVNAETYRMSNSNYRSTTLTEKRHLKYSYGLDILPGFYISKAINLYVMIGFQQGRFKFSRNLAGSTSTDYNKQVRLAGYDAGIGTNFILANNFALRFTYKYTQYSGEKVRKAAMTDRITPRNGQFNLGIMYTYS